MLMFPEHHKPINSRYTILLAQPGVKPTEKQISEVEKALDMNTQVYAVGSYRHFICIGELLFQIRCHRIVREGC